MVLTFLTVACFRVSDPKNTLALVLRNPYSRDVAVKPSSSEHSLSNQSASPRPKVSVKSWDRLGVQIRDGAMRVFAWASSRLVKPVQDTEHMIAELRTIYCCMGLGDGPAAVDYS